MATATAAEPISSKHVHVLDGESFPSFVEANRMVLISIIHKLIPSCVRFMPIFVRTAQAMHDSEIQFAQIDRNEIPAMCQNFQIAAYPVVMLFQGIDNAKTYHGARREKDIISYLKRQHFPTISTIIVDSLQDFKEANDVVVVGFFLSDDRRSHEAFATLAEGLQGEFLFGVTCSDILAEEEKIRIPNIAVYKSFDEQKAVLESTHDTQLMSTFVKSAARPLIVEFLPELHDSYFKDGIPLGYIFTATLNDRDRLSKMIQPLAKKHKNKIQFGTVDIGDHERFPLLADGLFFKVDHWPSFTIREPIKNLRFHFGDQQELSEEVLDKFVQDFLDGKLKPVIKSGPLPEPPQGPVTEVVALNYDEIVYNNDKDVLLEFYSDGCAPCKTFVRTYEEFAALYASDAILRNQVTIARIDAEANEFPDRDIHGFPYFKLFPASAKGSPVLYFRPRVVKDMAEFIRDNRKHKAEIDFAE